MSQIPATTLTYLNENYERFQSELIELVRIPSISIDPEYKADMDKAAESIHKAKVPPKGHSIRGSKKSTDLCLTGLNVGISCSR